LPASLLFYEISRRVATQRLDDFVLRRRGLRALVRPVVREVALRALVRPVVREVALRVLACPVVREVALRALVCPVVREAVLRVAPRFVVALRCVDFRVREAAGFCRVVLLEAEDLPEVFFFGVVLLATDLDVPLRARLT